jgi:general stress protein 26
MTNDDSAAPDVWTAIKAHPVAMMTTLHEGEIISRPMQAHADAEEGAIYFVSKLESGKTHDIDTTSAVNLAFADHGNSTYVSIAGNAIVSQDRQKLRELWNMWAEAWLPDGPDSPDTTLITVIPDQAVIWDSNSSRIVRTIKTAVAAVTQTPPDMGRERKVEL